MITKNSTPITAVRILEGYSQFNFGFNRLIGNGATYLTSTLSEETDNLRQMNSRRILNEIVGLLGGRIVGL